MGVEVGGDGEAVVLWGEGGGLLPPAGGEVPLSVVCVAMTCHRL